MLNGMKRLYYGKEAFHFVQREDILADFSEFRLKARTFVKKSSRPLTVYQKQKQILIDLDDLST
jgi:hypothetical protein